MATNYTIKKTISFIKNELKNQYPDTEISGLIYIIFEYFLNYSKTELQISQNKEIPNELFKKIYDTINELKTNKPIQYILGETYFFDLKFKVTKDVLIPRQETEELVDWVIEENKNKNIKILDIGSGSGCIAISLAKNLTNANVYASDISKKALLITKHNSELNNADIQTLQFDILNAPGKLDTKFDVIVSNPPYITEKEKALINKNVIDYEPDLALFVPDNNPLLFYKAITLFALKHLNTGGKIYFEINEAFGEETTQLMKENSFKDVL